MGYLIVHTFNKVDLNLFFVKVYNLRLLLKEWDTQKIIIIASQYPVWTKILNNISSFNSGLKPKFSLFYKDSTSPRPLPNNWGSRDFIKHGK